MGKVFKIVKFTCKDTCFYKDIEKKFCKKFNRDVTHGKCKECVLIIKMVVERGGFTRVINRKTKMSRIIVDEEIFEQVAKEVMNEPVDYQGL